MFSDAQLAGLRRFQESSFRETATIIDPKGSEISDGMGGIITGPVTIGTERCRVAAMPLARGELIVGGQLQGAIPWEISLPLDTATRERYQIVVNGVTYEVVALWGPNTYGTTTKAICMKV